MGKTTRDLTPQFRPLFSLKMGMRPVEISKRVGEPCPSYHDWNNNGIVWVCEKMMRLKIKNFHLIKRADIQFEGLTVIAGENDTGKSTVGKILFSEIRNALLKTNSEKVNNIELSIENEITHFPIFIDSPDFLSKFNYLKNTMVLSQQYQLNFS